MDVFNQRNKGFALQKMRYLTAVSKTDPHLYYDREKKILPSFMFVSDKQFINESVHFEIHWGTDTQKGNLATQEGKYITLEFSIFEDD
ncbi:Hypothetical predicted protein [Paramuricea clavata]|uniref:Uncharacterized protein n=1 Tax=Paramuricea clavata TaxID=317549 RepID=A0A7D9EVB9_PARCT|nr:Hypothetical predicted protein [Paramuricea clavata]